MGMSSTGQELISKWHLWNILWRSSSSSSPRMVNDIDRCHVMSARLMPVELNWLCVAWVAKWLS